MSQTTQSFSWSEWRLWGQGYAWSTRYTASSTITVTRNIGSDTATVKIETTMTTPSGDSSLGDWQCIVSINGASSGGGEKTFTVASAGYHAENSSYTASQTYTVNVGVSAGTLSGQIKMRIGGYAGYQGEYSEAKSWSLTYDTKGTPSQATWTNAYFGNTSTITIQRTVPDFRESVYLVWQDDTSNPVTIRTYSQSSATTISYTIPYNALGTTSQTRSAKIRVVSYNGSTQIGTWETSAVSVGIKSGDTTYNPTLNANPVAEAYNDVVSALGTDTAVAQFSKINVKANKSDVSLKHNATIVSRVVTFSNGSSASADQTNHISSLIQSAGDVTWTYTVTDSRGLKVTRTGTYTVINSSAPSITNVTVYRGDSTGTAQDGGEYIYATATATCESLNGHNTVTLQGKVGSGSYQNMTNGTRKTLMNNADPNTQYVVTLKATDLLRTTTMDFILPSADCPFHIPPEKHGIGIGTKGTGNSNTATVGYDLDVIAGKKIKYDGKGDLVRLTPHLAQVWATSLPSNANLNTTTYLKVGTYFTNSSATAQTFTNCPTGKAFNMTVETPIHASYDNESSSYVYRIRRITTYDGETYIQYCSTNGSAVWGYGAWYKVNTSLASEDGNVAQWLNAMVGRQSSVDFGHIYDGDKVHCRLDIVSGSLGSDSPFDGDGYVLTFMWDNSGAWDTQVFFPNGGGHPSFRKRSNGSWAKNAIQFVTTEVEDLSSQLVSKHSCLTSASLKRNGSVYSLTLRVNGTVPTTAWTTICSIPSTYAPSAQTAGNVAHGNTANVTKNMSVLISTNVEVRLSQAMSATTDYAIISATWIK